MHTCIYTHTHTHTHTLMHSHITDGDGRTGGQVRREMFVAGATREQKSSEGGLQRLEFKK